MLDVICPLMDVVLLITLLQRRNGIGNTWPLAHPVLTQTTSKKKLGVSPASIFN